MPDVSVDELLHAVLARRQRDAEFSKENYYDLIDEVIEEFQADALITDDEDIEFTKSQLRNRWEEVKKEDAS